jgi:DNA-binding winged helix-turn-helix (wHTH) protein/TolB-like protein
LSNPERSSEPRRRQYCFRDFTLDLERGFLWRGVEEVKLRPKSFEVLTYLIEHQGRVVTKDELASAVWAGASTTNNSLSQCLLEVRRALADDSQELIRTVARRGYIFTMPTTTPIASEPIGLAIASDPRTLEGHRETRADSPSSGILGATPSKVTSIQFLATVVLLTILGGGVFWYYRVAKSDQPATLAILPFKSIGSQSQDEYLELGMTDALITRLGNLNRIIVRPTTAVRKYTTAQDPVAAGRELGVTAVVEGSVQRLNNRVRVSARLLRVSDGRSLWADNFDGNFSDVFSFQDSISAKIGDALLRRLS